MPIIDRYIVTVFVKIFVICFVSFAGLFVVVDAFTNLEEFLDLKQTNQNLGSLMFSYYGPRILQFFDKTAPLIALVAAVFSLAVMQRSNELTAIAAAGISRRRIARPILIITLVLLGLTVLNREVLIPKYRNQLAMNAQDLSKGKGRPIRMTVDRQTGIMLRGSEVMPVEQTIKNPAFTLPTELAAFGTKIAAENGSYLNADNIRPAGYLLENVTSDPSLSDSAVLPSQQLDGETVIFRPGDNEWLESNEVFVRSSIDTLYLAFGKDMDRNSSLVEMIENSKQPKTTFSNRHRVDLHARVVQPFFDFTILLIGLPLVIARGQKSLFVSAGVCLAVVMAMVLTVIASHSLGASRLVAPPSLAAWLPLLLFAPVAFALNRLLDTT